MDALTQALLGAIIVIGLAALAGAVTGITLRGIKEHFRR